HDRSVEAGAGDECERAAVNASQIDARLHAVHGDIDGGLERTRDAEVLRDLLRGAARDGRERDSRPGETGGSLGECTAAAAQGNRAIAQRGGLACEIRRVSRAIRCDQIERGTALGKRTAETASQTTLVVVTGVRIDNDERTAGSRAGRTQVEVTHSTRLRRRPRARSRAPGAGRRALPSADAC